MTFISFAQNFEDVMLWRALKHIQDGFYIDVGANDPSIDSVTRGFYERGWHGINIEPLTSHCADLWAQRERDITLQCAAGAENGELVLWESDVRGWATASLEVIAQHAANGHQGIFHKVPVRRLTEICEEFILGDIHFLKIDVEGLEESVIRGMDFSRFRPWILVIEATKPNSTKETHDEWESIVLDAGYVLAYCDGLNRFYVATEHSELLDSLRYPPNVFDNFVRSEQLNSELRVQQAESKALQLESHVQQAEEQAQIEARRAEQAEEQVQIEAHRAEQAEEQVQIEARRAEQAEEQVQIEARRAEQAEEQVQIEARRAEQAEEQVQIEARRAEQAEEQVQIEARRAEQAEEQAQIEARRAEQVEARAQQAEEQAQIEAHRAEQSDVRAKQAEARVQQLESRLHQKEHDVNEWHERVLALHNSTSWKITKPMRALGRIIRRQSTVVEVASVSTAHLKLFMRTKIVSAIKWAADRAQSSVGFKRFALRFLRRYPLFHQKLRKIYLENQYREQPQPVNWSGTVADTITPVDLDVPCDKEYVISQSVPSGINANQRTPLESSLMKYLDRP